PAQRRALLLLSTVPGGLITAVVAFRQWPLQAAVGHLAVLALLGSILSGVALYSFHKISFTCFYLPGKAQMPMAFLGAAGLLWAVLASVRYEIEALQNATGMTALIGILLLLAVAARWLAVAAAGTTPLRFEEEEAPAVQLLGLR